MTSENTALMRTQGPRRSPRSRIARWLSGSALLLLVALAASGSVACEQEEFKCCECFFPSCQDSTMNVVPQLQCSCTQIFSYEACGKFCEQDAAVALFMGGFTACGTASSLAKDSCSVGNPVGTPP
jgi:hypothetical protein